MNENKAIYFNEKAAVNATELKVETERLLKSSNYLIIFQKFNKIIFNFLKTRSVLLKITSSNG